MIECSACNLSFRPGTLFCIECGARLSSDDPLPTEPLPPEELPSLQITPGDLVDEHDDTKSPSSARVLGITIVRSNCQVLFPLPINEIRLGRRDASRDVFPHLDLTSDGGGQAGVSRNHARIHQRDDELFVEDMASSNGTFLNSRRIIPHRSYPLRKGDTLQLGKLQLLVEFGVL